VTRAALDERRRERDRLVALARAYVERLGERVPVVAAAVAGSVARGDFNVWSDVDVVVVAERLPARALDRAGLLMADAPGGVQPVGYTPGELDRALRRGDPLVTEAVTRGIVLGGASFFEAARP
jgi:predicted nucleotidyltransferase